MIPDSLLKGVHISQLPQDSEQAVIGHAVEKTISTIIDRLRSPSFPDPEIQKLAELGFQLIHNRVVLTALTEVPSLSFFVEVNKQTMKFNAILMVPNNWPEMVNENTIYQFGALIYNLSKIKDFWNAKILDKVGTAERSYAYEAQWLLYVKTEDPTYKFNDYQQQILSKYPNGLSTCSHHYETKPVNFEEKDVPKS